MTMLAAPPGWTPWGGNEATCVCGNEFVPDGDQTECDECEAQERAIEHAEGLRKQMREEPDE